MDHEMSTSSLDKDQVGWDWFALHLDDGSDLMLYQLRDLRGKKSPYSSGSYVSKNGEQTHLTSEAFTLSPQSHWTSPSSSTRYPRVWQVEVPSLGLKLNVEARVANQEMRTSVPYWEGSVAVSGSHTGLGYLEMTGYQSSLRPILGH